MYRITKVGRYRVLTVSGDFLRGVGKDEYLCKLIVRRTYM